MLSNTTVASTVGVKQNLGNPDVDGIMTITGPSGKLLHQLALSGESNFAHIETKIGQRRYTIDICQIRGSDTQDLPKAEKPRHVHLSGICMPGCPACEAKVPLSLSKISSAPIG